MTIKEFTKRLLASHQGKVSPGYRPSNRPPNRYWLTRDGHWYLGRSRWTTWYRTTRPRGRG